MPLYEYLDTRTGRTVELIRSVRQRDCVPGHLRRVTVPARLSVMSGIPDPGAVDTAAPKGIRDLERSIGAEAVSRETGYSPKQLKRIWNFQSTYRN